MSRLDEQHPSAVEGRTRYRARVVAASVPDRLLKSGEHNRKIGSMVVKGEWSGFPIFTLTLEERATCPRSCQHWLDCYGNKMNWSERIEHGPELEDRLAAELAAHQRAHPSGFIVRLHVLGDFYSEGYVRRWLAWLETFPALHVFGYSAHQPGSPIGDLIRQASADRWDRFAIRTSNGPDAERSTRTLTAEPASPTVDGAIVCPAQTGKSSCCGACALCWSTTRNIAFLAH